MQYPNTAIEHECHSNIDGIGLLDIRDQMRK